MKPLLDVLIILDALEKEGSFAAASAKLYKTPSALSYTIHRLENDLNIQLLDRSGHRAKFTRTGKMLLEKGREVLHIVRELEKQAVKLNEGWENELFIAVDESFPFSLLVPLVASFYQHHHLTRLMFTRDRSDNGWAALTQGRADIVVGVQHEPLPLSDLGFMPLGQLEYVFAVAPHHPLAQAPEPLSWRDIKAYRAVVTGGVPVADGPAYRQLIDDQEAIAVFDIQAKLELHLHGLGCGYLPRYLTQPFLDDGALVAKTVAIPAPGEPAWIGWNEQTAGLACAWWRSAILSNKAITALYQPLAPTASKA